MVVSTYNNFVKANYSKAKKAVTGSPTPKKVMTKLGEMWRKKKGGKKSVKSRKSSKKSRRKSKKSSKK